MKGISAQDYIDFYLKGREESTIRNYGGAFQIVWNHADKIGNSIFEWGEGEVAGLVVKLAKEKKGENLVKKCSAVVNMIFEVAGLEEPTKGGTLKMIKKSAIKMMNLKKNKPLKREGTSLEDVEIMVKEIYMRLGDQAPKSRRRFLILQLFLFLGLKRFSDINRIKVQDIKFNHDQSIDIWMKKTKTDKLARGEKFTISGQKMSNGVSVSDVATWYMKSLKLTPSSFFFCQINKHGEAIGDKFFCYHEARLDLIKEQLLLGIKKISLHSGRIGGATEAAAAGVGRAEIMEAGGWVSSAVDVYIQPKGKGQEVSRRLVEKLKL